MKALIGLVVAFSLGLACRLFGIPSPAPPLIMGALLVMAMTVGYILVDRVMTRPARHAKDCGGADGQPVTHASPASGETRQQTFKEE